MHHKAGTAEVKHQKQTGSNLNSNTKTYLARDLMQPDPVFLRPYSTIQQAMELFRKLMTSSVLIVTENVLDSSFQLCGRISIKEILRHLFPGLKRKDLIVLNQVLHEPVEKVMNRDCQSLSVSSDIKEILSVMLSDYLQAIGVQQDGKLLSYISSTDLLRMFQSVIGTVSVPTTAKVSERMARHVLCLSPKDEISKAIEVFMATDVRHIAILDAQGKLLRILHQVDVLEYILELIESKELTEFEKKGLILDRNIGSLVEKGFTTVSQNTGLIEAAKKMTDYNVTCLAVTDVQQRFYGLLSFAEILTWLQEHLK